MGELKNIVIIGPVYPYKGGISHYTSLMSASLSKEYNVTTVSYSMQYPKLLFRKPQKDYDNKTFEIKDTQYLINTANPFNIISAAKKIKAMKPDLIIVQWWHPYFAPCYQMLLGKLKNIKKIFICHNVLPHERFPFDSALVKGTLKKADGCIVHSTLDGDNLKTLLPKMTYRMNVHPTYNAFKIRNISRETAREELGINKEAKILLFFGFVRKYKGLTHMLKAMPHILSVVPDIKLYVVGDFGKDKGEYIELINNSNISDAVVIKDGYVPDQKVEAYFAAADICVCPYESATQSGIVQIAFGFGLPVLATNVGGLPEVVDDNKTGYVVEPFNPEAISRAVIDFYSNNRRDEMVSSVYKESERFSWQRMNECIENLYNEI